MPLSALHVTLLSDRHTLDDVLLPPKRPVSLYTPCPAPPRPTTVTLCPPVMAAFVNTALHNDTPSIVNAASKLPTPSNEVAARDRTRQTPVGVLAVTPLLDIHSVDTAWLPPSRSIAVYCMIPDPEPTTVTLCDPVVASFDRVGELNPGPSVVINDVKLPTRVTAVTLLRTAADNPAATRNCSPLVETHSVDIDPVPPIRILPVTV